GIATLVGIAVAIGFTTGWLRDPRQHVLPLVLGGLVFLVIFATFILLAVAILVLTKDFVIPQMALENVGVGDGWSRLWERMKSEKGGFAGYVGFKILLNIAAMVGWAIAGLCVALVLAIPMAVIALVVIFGGRAIGLVWNPVTLAIAIVAACIGVAIILFALLLTATPMVVFFPAYAIHFF